MSKKSQKQAAEAVTQPEAPSTAQRLALIVERVTRKMGRGAQVNYTPLCSTVAGAVDSILQRNQQIYKSKNTDKITREVIAMSVPFYPTVDEWDADVAERKSREEAEEREQVIRHLSARQRALLGLTLTGEDTAETPPDGGDAGDGDPDAGEPSDNGQQTGEPTAGEPEPTSVEPEPAMANA